MSRPISKWNYEVTLVSDFSALVWFFWTKKIITIPLPPVSITAYDWVPEVDVVDDKLDLNVLNLSDIDKVIPTCCPKNLIGFKSWLIFWLRDYAKKGIKEKTMAEFLNNAPPKPSDSLNLGPGRYRVNVKPIVPARVRVPVKFTITTKYKCEDNDENCECTIECDKSKFILTDINNVPIQPIDVDSNSDGGPLPSWFVPIATLDVPSAYFNQAV
jgi:hypothetical protein